MKKKIIVGAGVAALAAVALPFAGVFADSTTVNDAITVNVTGACIFTEISPAAATSVDGNPHYGSGAPGALVSISAGTESTSGTATSVKVYCNSATGYKISTSFSSLTGPTGSTPITYSSSPVASGGTGTWTAYSKLGTSGALTPINATNGITGNSTTTDVYTFSYEAGLDVNQAAGNYTGTATYTLAANS